MIKVENTQTRSRAYSSERYQKQHFGDERPGRNEFYDQTE